MKFTCDKASLQNAINIASKATSPKSPIPSLEGILIEAGEGKVGMTGYDLKKGIYTSVEASVSEPGSVVIGARIFGDIVRSLPNGNVTVKTSGKNNVTISCDNSEFSIIFTDSTDYPELPSVDGRSGVCLPQSLLGDMIRRTIFAISDNEARPVYTGALFEIGTDDFAICACDGYRLAIRREKAENISDQSAFIVPGNALSDLEKLCSDNEDETVEIILGSKHIKFTIGNTVLISRRLEGEFINYKKAVPSQFNVSVTAERTVLQRSVERVSLIIDDKIKNPLRCTFGDHEIRVMCATALGKAEDICPVDGSGNDVVVGFNNRYLLDALKAAPADNIKININTGSSPCVITPEDESDQFLYMILPVRLKAGE